MSLSCERASIQLQARSELTEADDLRLEEHLGSCPACREVENGRLAVDRALAEGLDGLGLPSVRPGVLLKLRASPQSQRRPRLHVAWAAAIAVGLLAVLLAVQVLPDATGRAPQARAAFHPRRPYVGFPLAVDPRRKGHLVAGAWGAVYESWNAGQSWHALAALPSHLVVRGVAIDASRPNRYLVAVKHSVYVSSNAGRSWTSAVSSLRGAENMFLTQDPVSLKTFFLGPSVVWKSIDHGATWKQDGAGRIFGPDGVQSVAVAPDGTLYTGIWSGGVAVSRDGGRTWQRRARGLPPKVMDVATDRTILWAATSLGAFRSDDGGLAWRDSHVPGHLFTTTVVADRNLVLAGGDGALYRSTNGGRRWMPAENGLPLDPYINSLTADPMWPGRIYASLNGDGLFRSEDSGLHWSSINAGIPLRNVDGGAGLVLFLRGGALWETDERGTDPGVLTTDTDVGEAALSPDGAEAAYVAGRPRAWSVRVVATGGSAARTLWAGNGDLPEALMFAPDATRLAIVQRSEVTVTNLSHQISHWRIRFGERPIAWTEDGSGLLWWRTGGRVLTREWKTGKEIASTRGTYPNPPERAPNGRLIADLAHGELEAGAVNTLRPLKFVGSQCSFLGWSPDSSRLLLRCGGFLEVRTTIGGVVASRFLSAGHSFWGTGHRRVLFFRHNGLWAWDLVANQIQRLVANASSPSPR